MGPTTLPSNKLIEESYSGMGVAPLLEAYVDDITLPADGAIEIMQLSTNANEHLVHIPGIAIPTIAPTQSVRVARPAFLAPPPSDRGV